MNSNGKEYDRTKLKDINEVSIDMNDTQEVRIKKFIEQIGNPYCYLDNGIVVEIGYADTTSSLQDCLLSCAEIFD